MAAGAEMSGDAVPAVPTSKNSDSKSEFGPGMQSMIVDMLSNLKLNPLAKEFFPSSYSHDHLTPTNFSKNSPDDAYPNNRRRRNNYNQGRRRLSGRAFRAQREDSIRRTVYVSDIDQHVTEERLAGLFSGCGQVIGMAFTNYYIHRICQFDSLGLLDDLLGCELQCPIVLVKVVDCRVCGDPHSVLRFAFVEFADEHGARAALNLGGTMLGYYPVRVLPSKTAILPVNPTFLPRSEDEREMCARTVYCTNIDKKVSQAEVKNFFERACGEVSRLRLLGDHVHSTRIAFVEFAMAESAIVALNCSGLVLGTQPIRVSPSKTPVRPRVPRATLH